MTRFSTNSVISDVLTLTRGELQRHDILLETELSAGLQPVMGDRGQMQQVVLNPVVNGIEAMTASTATSVVEVHKRKAGPGRRILQERNHRCRR
jgi:signal transduction histidine kinase